MCYIYLLSKSISDQIIDIFAFSMFFVERRSQGLHGKVGRNTCIYSLMGSVIQLLHTSTQR